MMTLPLLLFLLGTAATQEILQNPDFEETTLSDGAWSCPQCDLSSSTDSYTGKHSAKVENRKQDWGGISQNVQLIPGHYYNFTGYIKLLNVSPNKMYEQVEVVADLVSTDNQNNYLKFGNQNRAIANRWQRIGGDMLIPATPPLNRTRLYIQVVGSPGVNYIVDSLSLQDITPGIEPYMDDTENRIKRIRQADVNIRVDSDSHSTSGLTVELAQISSEFAWGSAIAASYWNDHSREKYRQFFLNLFEWAVLENAMKWYSTESNENHFNYGPANATVHDLRSKNITVRGHNIFWAVEQYVPNWQKGMSADALKAKMLSHIQKVVGTFKGEVVHWDVNNENLHGDFYASKLHDPDITNWMFTETHKVDPDVYLFLNDYNVVTQSDSTVTLLDQALRMKSLGIPVGGIGAQGHFTPPICMECIKVRLDQLAVAGLPVFITELDINEQDMTKRAQYYEDVLRVFFSHPAVKGVIFWGYWDQRHWRYNAAIASGNDVTPNLAGQKVIQLLKHDWRTNLSQELSSAKPVHVRAFKGKYRLTIKHQGTAIHEETFTLGDKGVDLTVKLSAGGDHPGVVVIG